MRLNHEGNELKKLPKVTFIVCTYNCRENAKNCFTSIKEQDYPGKVELIASDGGSTDGTVEMLESMGVKVLFNKEKYPEGRGRGKWLGYKNATGDIVIFIDSDNTLVEKTWLREMVKPLATDTSVNFCICRMAVVKTDKAINRYLSFIGTDPFVTDKSIDSLLALGKLKLTDKGDYYTYNITKENLILTSGFYFTIWKKNLDAIGGYTQDTDVVFNLAQKGIANVAIAKYAHVHHLVSDSIITFTKKKYWWADIYFRIQIHGRDFHWIPADRKGRLKIMLKIVKNFLFIPELVTGVKMSVRYREPAWLLHPVVVWLTTMSYVLAYLKNKISPR